VFTYFASASDVEITSPSQIAVVGDRLLTDVMMANLMGAHGFWVKDGVMERKTIVCFSPLNMTKTLIVAIVPKGRVLDLWVPATKRLCGSKSKERFRVRGHFCIMGRLSGGLFKRDIKLSPFGVRSKHPQSQAWPLSMYQKNRLITPNKWMWCMHVGIQGNTRLSVTDSLYYKNRLPRKLYTLFNPMSSQCKRLFLSFNVIKYSVRAIDV